MKYCSNCGEKINANAQFCNGCGTKTGSSKNSEPFRNIEPQVIQNLNNYFKGFGKAIIWIIIILVLLFIFIAIISNMDSNGGSLNVYSNSQNSWWGTTHKTTSVGAGGITTEEHSCPFWNRNC